MLVFPIAALETDIPTADYELIISEETNESESIAITSSTYSPVSSVLITNESVMNPSSNWNAIQNPRSDSNYFEKIVSVPYLNVSDLILTVSAFVVDGPLEISMEGSSTIGQTGEYCKVITHMVPEVDSNYPGRASIEYIRITFASTDWNVIDEIYFSLEAIFTDIVCPVTVDLQRTNGESMYLLPEFRTIYDNDAFPYFHFEDDVFIVFQPNVTIYIPNGNYSLVFQWMEYNHSFTDLLIMNESIHLTLRITSVRLDVESLQKIPLVAIEVQYHAAYGYRHMYEEEYMIKESPSFYIPSGNIVRIIVEGGPTGSHYKPHFIFIFEAGDDNNVTLIVDENWILVGNIAFTPARAAMFLSSIFIIGLVVVVARKQLSKSPIYGPFMLLLLGSLLPTVEVIYQRYISPTTFPLYSLYSERSSYSLQFATMQTQLDGSITTISSAVDLDYAIMGPFSFFFLCMAFLGVALEVVGKERVGDIQEVLFVIGLVGTPTYQLVYILYFVHNVVPGVGLLVSSFAVLLSLALVARMNKSQRYNASPDDTLETLKVR